MTNSQQQIQYDQVRLRQQSHGSHGAAPLKKHITNDINNGNDGNALLLDFPKDPLRKSHRQNSKNSNQSGYSNYLKYSPSTERKKSVRISPTSTLHTWTLQEYEHEEGCSSSIDSDCTSSWHTKQEIGQFRKQAKLEALLLRRQLSEGQLEQLSLGITTIDEVTIPAPSRSSQSSQEDTLVTTTTGIEHLLHKPTLDKLIQIRSARTESLLEEQWRQVTMSGGITDPLALRNVSRGCSKWGRKRAVILAGGGMAGMGGIHAPNGSMPRRNSKTSPVPPAA